MMNVLEDNIKYLNAWFGYNPKLKETLAISDHNLICKINDTVEEIDLNKFYLPEILYNEPFRNDVANDLTGEDLFNIIKIYTTTKEIEDREQADLANYIIIKNLTKKDDKTLIIDSDDNLRYKYTPKYDINLYFKNYEKLKVSNYIITLNDIERMIEDGNN